MHQRPIKKSLPGLERLEEKQLLSAGPSTRPLAHLESGSRALASRGRHLGCCRGRGGVATGHWPEGRNTEHGAKETHDRLPHVPHHEPEPVQQQV